MAISERRRHVGGSGEKPPPGGSARSPAEALCDAERVREGTRAPGARHPVWQPRSFVAPPPLFFTRRLSRRDLVFKKSTAVAAQRSRGVPLSCASPDAAQSTLSVKSVNKRRAPLGQSSRRTHSLCGCIRSTCFCWPVALLRPTHRRRRSLIYGPCPGCITINGSKFSMVVGLPRRTL